MIIKRKINKIKKEISKLKKEDGKEVFDNYGTDLGIANNYFQIKERKAKLELLQEIEKELKDFICSSKFLELLSDLEHKQWSHWTNYFLKTYTFENKNIWKKEIETDYKDLTEKQKESDRVWVRKVINKIIKNII